MVAFHDSPHFTEALRAALETTLHEKNAHDVVVIDLAGKSDIADYMIIASGTSTTHVGALADHVERALRNSGIKTLSEGQPQNDWVLVYTPYIIVQLFRPEVRQQYQLEKMWQADFSALEQSAREKGGQNAPAQLEAAF